MTRIFAHTGVLSTRIPMPKYMQAYFSNSPLGELETIHKEIAHVFLQHPNEKHVITLPIKVTFSFDSEIPFVYFATDEINLVKLRNSLNLYDFKICVQFSKACQNLMRIYRTIVKNDVRYKICSFLDLSSM